MEFQLSKPFLLSTTPLAILATLLVPQHGATAQVVAFENAHIVDPINETIVEGTIIVRNGRIEELVTKTPKGFTGERIDLGNRWVIPGLVDIHTHSFGNMSPGGAPQMLGTAGVADVALYSGVTAFLDLFNLEDTILSYRDAQRRGEHGGATVFASGPCLTATNGHCSEYGIPTRIVDTPEDARREVDALAAKQPDVIKIVYDNQTYGTRRMPTVDRATLQAVVEAARRHNLKTIVHIGTWDDVRDAVEVGAAAVTHTPGPMLPPADLISAMVDAGTYHIPTLAVQGDYSRIVDDGTLLDNPLLMAVTTPALLDAYRPTGGPPAQMEGWLTWQRTLVDANKDAVKALADAGVPMMTGTDGGNFGVFQGYSVHRELQLLVAAGLSPWEALRAATTNAAAFLEQDWGFAPGDEATFVVLDQSPIEDIAHTTQVQSVVQRGVVVDREGLLPGR